MSIFDVIKDLYEKKEFIEQNKDQISGDKSISNYMLNRFLSMNESLIPLINEVQVYSSKLDKMEYIKLLNKIIPQRNNPFYRYVKKNKEFVCLNCGFHFNSLEKKSKLVCRKCSSKKIKQFPIEDITKFLSRYFEVSKKEARSYMKLLSDNDIIILLKKFGELSVDTLDKFYKEDKKENKKLILSDF